MIDSIGRFIVRVVRAGHHRRAWLSGLALVVTLVVGVTYLAIGALRINPLNSTYRITIRLPESGGLLANQDVSVRGIPVGRIQSLRPTPTGVEAIATIDANTRIPLASPVRVSGLSPAGEQYIDFEPASNTGPFLSNGSVIGPQHTATPIPLSQVLADANGLLAQTDPKKLEIVKRELSLSKEGPQKLTDIIDGATFLLSTMDPVLPQTVSMLKTSRVVLTTLADKNAGLGATSRNVGDLMTGVNKMDRGYRKFVDQTPHALSSVDNLFDDNSDTMVGLLANLVTTARIIYVRVPALNAVFPDYRGSTLEALMTTMHEHGLWATADIYPRYTCDYGTPRRPSSSADYPEPFLYTYCRDDDPQVLIRGAKNAPRPGGDDTAGPPPGADLGQTADPTPKGRFTIPTPYGGPALPIEPPH
ncbi:MlaD family protein [Mycobacterium mantenii]|uniref:Mammalian cell entry protein n=1 Tax=Mycobacterium mantenii TaxID=560555 RepID=A0A1A2TFF0_MYCNT|nr:MlaD family protein [Mycobacterium mantenii]OBH42263.1 mammalian cell entry protein [Mycobacterium mantenii]OBH75075.1 mammalian cell entry protein [Mycobacterium mantenii]